MEKQRHTNVHSYPDSLASKPMADLPQLCLKNSQNGS